MTTPLGSATGTAVDEHVVLTAASALFDDHNLRCVDEVRWRQHPHAGAHNAKPLRSRGWTVVGQGYSAEFQRQRQIERTPGDFSARSWELDVAAMYFFEPVARGGESGYVVGNGASNPWLTQTRDRQVFGDPISGPAGAGIMPGQMHATTARDDFNFTHVQGPVFETTDFQKLPGMLGVGDVTMKLNIEVSRNV
ncbi:MAG: hypothetical protein AAF585_07640 [Verrucomicrobiota bacterium]